MNGPRNLWEQYKLYRRSREPRKLWERLAEWDFAFQILFLAAIIVFALVASLFGR